MRGWVLFLAAISCGAVTVSWDMQEDAVFRVYQSTNAAAPFSEWQVVVVTTNDSATFEIQPERLFFSVSASNFWGEVFSEVVSTPRPLGPVGGLKIRK